MYTSVALLLGVLATGQAEQEKRAEGVSPLLNQQQKDATISWIQSLQKDNGGFGPDKRPDAPATMSTTATALRALQFLAAQPKNKEACSKFVMSCFDKKLGGFAAVPAVKPDKQATAEGLMAAALLSLAPETYQTHPVIYLCSCVKKREDIQRTAAAYEVARAKCELAQDWIVAIQNTQNPDGTFGKDNQVIDTATAVATLRRLGAPLKKTELVHKFLIGSRQSDGGWGKDRASDLETTFAVTQALVFLKDRPDAKVGVFVARCRNDDGGYGLRPGEPSLLRTTFCAVAVLHSLNTAK